MDGIIREIIETEWTQFDKVQNRGGRAACQDDWKTFAVMRSSQFQVWTQALLESYRKDLRSAQKEGRNLFWEKYARMMERTAPSEYEALKDTLPVLSPEKLYLSDLICAAHVLWQEELAEQYPRLTGHGRPIRKENDGPGITSFETYLRGELLTYSVESLRLYAAFVDKSKKERVNLCEQILRNTVQQYGFSTLEEAESRQP